MMACDPMGRGLAIECRQNRRLSNLHTRTAPRGLVVLCAGLEVVVEVVGARGGADTIEIASSLSGRMPSRFL